ncbi:hypothetical protein P692DRAFT_201856431 [Suillus brevipes Sb2]|nr:hypothetical protein P692DRAFT_201856431 [Suillus brevipes Sb2]
MFLSDKLHTFVFRNSGRCCCWFQKKKKKEVPQPPVYDDELEDDEQEDIPDPVTVPHPRFMTHSAVSLCDYGFCINIYLVRELLKPESPRRNHGVDASVAITPDLTHANSCLWLMAFHQPGVMPQSDIKSRTIRIAAADMESGSRVTAIAQ